MMPRQIEPDAYGSDHSRKPPENHFLAAVLWYLDHTRPGTVEAVKALAAIVGSEARKPGKKGEASRA